MANQCKECGCACSKCAASNDHDVHLHVEIENLKQRLVERDTHIVTMETNFLNEANKFPNGELVALRDELVIWQDKYKRLYEAHRRVQRVNQGLEDKLLRLVDVTETDKNTLTKDVANLSHKLAEANYAIKKLSEDNERYKNDVSLAIQFLQCKQGNFVSQKFDTLPNEVQAKVSNYMVNKRQPQERKSPPEIKSIKVPIPTFPPTAMVYSIPKSPNANHQMEKETENPVDIVSAAIMAKVLEERERERSCLKHCDTCTCSKTFKIIHHQTHHTVSTQTGEYDTSACLHCNIKLERPSIVKIVKNVENINKTIPVYIHDYNDSTTNQNIAKVQPNNFLTDTKNDRLDNLIDLSNSEESIYYNVNEKKDKTKVNTATHRAFYRSLDESKKVETPDIYKGGRYCSMRLQTGSKNILLDNNPNDVSPVLYTRHNESKSSSKITKPDSISSDALTISSLSENTSNVRVAEWIESNMNIGSASDYSESLNSQKTDEREVDKEKYKAMEDNVKRFLFGEHNFLKTVEIGKHKYDDKKVND